MNFCPCEWCATRATINRIEECNMTRRSQERHEERHDGLPAGGRHHYQMRQNLVSIGDDFWIENEVGQRAFKVDGRALRVRNTLSIEDASGHELCKIQERM